MEKISDSERKTKLKYDKKKYKSKLLNKVATGGGGGGINRKKWTKNDSCQGRI